MQVIIENGAVATPTYATLDALWRAWRSWRAADEPAALEVDHGTLLERLLAPVIAQIDVAQSADTAVIVATTKGDMPRQEAWMRAEEAENAALAPPLLSDIAERMARQLGAKGLCYVVSTACSSGLTALMDAAILIERGRAQQVVVIGVDTCSSFACDGFGALKALAADRCRPFDKARSGLKLGSAAAACVVRRAATRDDAYVLAGAGASADAVHMTAPDRTGAGLRRAIVQATERANLTVDAIDAVIAHGTGTRYNDAMEIAALQPLLEPWPSGGPAVTAVKGLLGHTLGASGLVETLLAQRMLAEQCVPAVVGLEKPESAELDFVMGAARPRRLRHILKTAAGFGGLNAAVIIGQCEG